MAELTVTGVGVATADPELRSVGQNNTSICTVNLAFNRSFKDKDDNWKQEPCFLRTQVWGNRAEKMAELVKKGDPVYITGYMKQDTWEDDEGKKKVAYSVTLRDFQLCVKPKKKDESQPKSKKKSEPVKSSVDDSEIPF